VKKTAKEVYLPPVIAYPDFHTAIGAIRDLPLRDPARTTKIDEAQRQYQERVRRAWRWGKDFVLHGQPKEEKPQPKFLNGLAEGNPEPFFHFVKHYGPRGLSFMLANEEILGHIEGWWIESILTVVPGFSNQIERE
jgi:hypothetical protein